MEEAGATYFHGASVKRGRLSWGAMFARGGLVLALLAAPARADDTPAAPPNPPSARLAADEDDPKLQRMAEVHERGPDVHTDVGVAHKTPSLKVAYRRLSATNLDGSDLPFNAFELDLYPISAKWVRVALEGELGLGSGTIDAGKADQQATGAWYLVSGFAVGLHYPARVTPFLDARFVAGVIGGDVAGHSAVSWVYMGGLETGVELYIVDRLFLTVGLGWVHTTYHGVDIVYTRAHPEDDPHYMNIGGDSFTFKIGLGL
jgi:hypothetical protein